MTQHHEAADELGSQIDRLENLTLSLIELPLPDAVHVEALRAALPEVLEKMKSSFADATQTPDPWA